MLGSTCGEFLVAPRRFRQQLIGALGLAGPGKAGAEVVRRPGQRLRRPTAAKRAVQILASSPLPWSQATLLQRNSGRYRRADATSTVDLDLPEIGYRAPQATLCLASALARHDLTDLIPASIDIALPRGQRRPRVAAPVTWHAFAPVTFEIDRDHLRLDEQIGIGIYEPARCILNAFRLRHQEGSDLAIGALRRWLSRPGSQPATLLEMGRHFPHAEPGVRAAVEVLL